MLKIAITGGIGSGKTSVTDRLGFHGYNIIDADEISRGITAAGGAAIPYIRENFGDGFIMPDGSLDRAKMREVVFNDSEKKALLEAGTTRAVIDIVKQMLVEREQAGDDITFVSVPLLFEYGMHEGYDQTWLIVADMTTRIDRIKKRDGLPKEMIKKIMDSQMSDGEKEELATVIIDNSGTLDSLYRQIDMLLRALKTL